MIWFLETMTLPFIACLLLTGIHVYLGLHVVERRVIFVDLALAQFAALGALCGTALGIGHDGGIERKLFSLGFAVAGAAVFAISRDRKDRVPQEAVIGITYAFALAASILASINLAHGADELRELLTGSILWVRSGELWVAGLIYASVAAIHYAFRDRFLQISLDPAAAERDGINVPAWDFLFYVLFGVVVTSSVAIAGVLLVFAYLTVPAVLAMLLAESIRARLLIGWTSATVVSMFGLGASYAADLPSGPVIVVALCTVLAATAVVRAWLDRSRGATGTSFQDTSGCRSKHLSSLETAAFNQRKDQ